MILITKWKKRRDCFHHDRGQPGNPMNPAKTWIASSMIHTGMGKMFWCTNCRKSWFT